MISAVVLTKNEENNIIDCLETLLWCNEIIIIDDFSKDRTIDVIKSLNSSKIKIFQRKLENDFSSQRNFGLSKAKGEWVIFIDADEKLSNGLIGEMKDLLEGESPAYNGFYIERKDFMWGRQLLHGETGNIKLLRLAKKDSGVWAGRVHEIWDVKGSRGNLKMPLLHYPHQTIAEFLEDINYYTDLRSKELYDKGVQVRWWQIIAYPCAKFKLNYFLKLGFMDGIPGLIFALMMSFHSFLVRGKLWILWQKK